MSRKPQTFYPPPDLPRVGVETHAHLDSKQFNNDLEAVLQRAYAAGVAEIIQLFLSPERYEKGKALFAGHPDVYFALGIHPTEASLFDSIVDLEMRESVEGDARFKAIGEIGLDYYWKECAPQLQKEVFELQLSMARDLKLPLIIHCREAERDTFAILENSGFRGYPLVWHCFGGDKAMAARIIDNGWHLSIPGPVTYPANTALREAVAAVPIERLLVETDCPYLSPVPLRGKRNEPAYLGYTIAAMAEARGMEAAELWKICGDNARSFFNLSHKG